LTSSAICKTIVLDERKEKLRLKKLLIIVSVIVALALFLGIVDFFLISPNSATKISLRSSGENEILLKISYFLASGGYSVSNVSIDDGEYTGDGVGKYDGALGKYRISVSFGDVDPTIALLAKWRDNTVKINGVELKTKIVFPQTHGFLIYIGSDTPICVDNDYTSLINGMSGTLSIPICIN
jgi:hypothetical protein